MNPRGSTIRTIKNLTVIILIWDLHCDSWYAVPFSFILIAMKKNGVVSSCVLCNVKLVLYVHIVCREKLHRNTGVIVCSGYVPSK
jgi:hypothetical protein